MPAEAPGLSHHDIRPVPVPVVPLGPGRGQLDTATTRLPRGTDVPFRPRVGSGCRARDGVGASGCRAARGARSGPGRDPAAEAAAAPRFWQGCLVRKAVAGLVFVFALVVTVVLLRDPPSAPDGGPSAIAPPPQAVTRAPLGGLPWRSAALPPDVDLARDSSFDGEHAVFPVRGADGVRRLVVANGAGEVVRSVPGANGGPVRGVVTGSTLVVRDEDPSGAARLFTVDLRTGAERVLAGRIAVGALAVADDVVVVQEGQQCLRVFPADAEQTTHCPPDGWAISLLTSGPHEVQWRETSPDEPCATWFRLGAGGAPERVPAGEGACRAAAAAWFDGWEITTGVTPYEAGAAYPGPLVARRDGREVALDTTVLDAQVCGRHLYWLSRPRYPDQLGDLVRWRPGEDRVEVLDTGGPPGGTRPPRCVGGALSAVTAGKEPPSVLALVDP